MNQLYLFAEFTKIDREQRIVEGWATTEGVDSQWTQQTIGDVVDFMATKKAAAEWQQWANIREMHQPKAVGTATNLICDDDRRGLYVVAKIVDDQAWEKVKQGVYKGFSIGGRMRAFVNEFRKDLGASVRRITDYVMTEISIVDHPANPEALFTVVKRHDFEPQTDHRVFADSLVPQNWRQEVEVLKFDLGPITVDSHGRLGSRDSHDSVGGRILKAEQNSGGEKSKYWGANAGKGPDGSTPVTNQSLGTARVDPSQPKKPIGGKASAASSKPVSGKASAAAGKPRAGYNTFTPGTKEHAAREAYETALLEDAENKKKGSKGLSAKQQMDLWNQVKAKHGIGKSADILLIDLMKLIAKSA